MCFCHPEAYIRYVGKSAAGTDNRYRGHLLATKTGATTPVAQWITEHGPTSIVSITL